MGIRSSTIAPHSLPILPAQCGPDPVRRLRYAAQYMMGQRTNHHPDQLSDRSHAIHSQSAPQQDVCFGKRRAERTIREMVLPAASAGVVEAKVVDPAAVAAGFGRGPGAGMGALFGPGATSHRYNLTLSVNARNVLNRVNLSSPIGNLSSPFFGQSISLAGGAFSSAAPTASSSCKPALAFSCAESASRRFGTQI